MQQIAVVRDVSRGEWRGVFRHAYAARQLGVIQCSAFSYKNVASTGVLD